MNELLEQSDTWDVGSTGVIEAVPVSVIEARLKELQND